MHPISLAPVVPRPTVTPRLSQQQGQAPLRRQVTPFTETPASPPATRSHLPDDQPSQWELSEPASAASLPPFPHEVLARRSLFQPQAQLQPEPQHEPVAPAVSLLHGPQRDSPPPRLLEAATTAVAAATTQSSGSSSEAARRRKRKNRHGSKRQAPSETSSSFDPLKAVPVIRPAADRSASHQAPLRYAKSAGTALPFPQLPHQKPALPVASATPRVPLVTSGAAVQSFTAVSRTVPSTKAPAVAAQQRVQQQGAAGRPHLPFPSIPASSAGARAGAPAQRPVFPSGKHMDRKTAGRSSTRGMGAGRHVGLNGGRKVPSPGDWVDDDAPF